MADHQLHFLVLHHGYHGGDKDFSYLSLLLKGAPQPSRYILLEPKVNEGLKTDQGVVKCGERLHAYLLTAIEDAVQRALSSTPAQTGAEEAAAAVASSSSSLSGRPVLSSTEVQLPTPTGAKGAHRPQALAPVAVHMSFVTHSMGGLIVRAMLPQLSAALSARYAAVHWDLFCAIAVPHAGVRQMPSLFYKRVGDWVGRLFGSTGLKDMYLHTNTLPQLLLEEPYLQAWRSFGRRVLMGVVNDNTVMAYSSIFMVPPEDVALFETRRDATVTPPPEEKAKEDGEEMREEPGGGYGPRTMPSAVHQRGGLTAQRQEQHPDPVTATTQDGETREGETLSIALQVPYHTDTLLPPSLWPVHILPRERHIAERIIAAVAPFEVYLVDFRPLVDAALLEREKRKAEEEEVSSPSGAASIHQSRRHSHESPASSTSTTTPTTAAPPAPISAVEVADSSHGSSGRCGAYTMPHRAIVCKAPCFQPEFFGFVSEFVVEDLLGVRVPAEVKTAAATAGSAKSDAEKK